MSYIAVSNFATEQSTNYPSHIQDWYPVNALNRPLLSRTSSKLNLVPGFAFAMLMLLLGSFAGCNRDNPGKWPVEKVSEQMKNSLQLAEIELKPADGGYEGTGETAEGEKFKIIVKLEPSNSRYAYHAESDRGAFEDGYYEKK